MRCCYERYERFALKSKNSHPAAIESVKNQMLRGDSLLAIEIHENVVFLTFEIF